MFRFKGSSSRGSIILDVRCGGGRSETIHCKTKPLQSNCVRHCKQHHQRGVGESGSGRGTILQLHWKALHSFALTQCNEKRLAFVRYSGWKNCCHGLGFGTNHHNASPFCPPGDSRSRGAGTVSRDALRPVPVCNC